MRKVLLLLLLSGLSLALWGQQSSITDDLDSSIQTLEQVSETINLLQSNITHLNEVIANLATDSTASKQELEKQKILLDKYQSMLTTYKNRYEKLLTISKGLRSSLQVSQVVSVSLGVVAVGAVLVAIFKK